MPTYTSSDGTTKDTADMPTAYLERALVKAKREGNEANVEALQEELDSRS